MTQLPAPGLGARILRYRKLNGWSAEKLAGHTGGAVSRSIIASIESGRREDLTVRQFIALCFALEIPPVALLVDLENPFARPEVDRGEKSTAPFVSTATPAAVMHWLHGHSNVESRLASSKRVDEVIGLVDAYIDDSDTLARANVRGQLIHRRTTSGEDTREELRMLENRLHMSIGLLRNAGIEVPDDGDD